MDPHAVYVMLPNKWKFFFQGDFPMASSLLLSLTMETPSRNIALTSLYESFIFSFMNNNIGLLLVLDYVYRLQYKSL